MNLKIISKTDNDIHMEFEGEGHTILNLLKNILLEDDRVLIATYDTKFPIMDNPIFRLKTKDTDPVEVLKDAATKLISLCDEFLACYQSAVK